MRREFGVGFLADSGAPKPPFNVDQIRQQALHALAEYEPRIEDVDVSVDQSIDGSLVLKVRYSDKDSGERAAVDVLY